MKNNAILNKIPLICVVAFAIAHAVLFFTTSQLNDSGTVWAFLLILLLCYLLPACLFFAKNSDSKKGKIIKFCGVCVCLATYLFVTIFYLINLIAHNAVNFSSASLGTPAIIIYLVAFCIYAVCGVLNYTNFKKPKNNLQWATTIIAYLIIAVFVAMIIHAVVATVRVLGQTGAYRELVVLLEVSAYIVAIVVLFVAWFVCKMVLNKKVN